MSPSKLCTLLLTLILFLPPISALAADWPNFRNAPSNTGSSTDAITTLTPQWHSAAVSVEENGVVVANGVAYMTSVNGGLFAFNVTNGFNMPGFPVAAVPGSFSTPAVDQANGKIYLLSANSLYGFNLNGTVAFPPISVGGTGSNYSHSPVVDGGFVYFKAGGFLRKYTPAGAVAPGWPTPAAPGTNTQPAILGDFVYINTESGQIRKYNKLTGVEVFAGFPIATTGQQSSLAVANGRIFFKTDLLRVYDATTGTALWTAPIGPNATFYTTPAVAGGVVYVYGFDSRLYAFNEVTGAAIPGFPTVLLATSGDRNWSAPTVSGDKVLVAAGTTQRLKVVGAAGHAQAGQVLQEQPTFSTDLQGFDLCSPVVSDCYVFAMLDGGGLYAFHGGCGLEPPKGALVINAGAACTQSQTVTLTLGNNNDATVTEMRISEDPFFTGAVFVPYLATSQFTLSAGFGTKTVYAQLRNNLGQVSNVFTDQINFQQAVCTSGCDADNDGDIDKADLALISRARGKTALPGDPLDADGDGLITPNDVKACIPKCTRANCATQ